MIPIKLQLKNFLSYGSEVQTIDFTPYHLICLSGKNGHGKSALLDAITWALWGQARKTFGTSKADQGLLRLGQTQMFVVLDFEFNGQIYRVRREFAKTYGKPYAALDFGLLDAEKDELIPLTDKTIRQTQAKLESMLNLDIESFLNSAFLRQGQSNEFSKKTAKERKNVLATILGLNRYELLRSLSMEKVKEAYAQKDTIAAIQSKIEQELLQKEPIKNSLEQVALTMQGLNKQEQENASEKKHLHELSQKLANDQHNAKLLSFKFDQLLQEEVTHKTAVRTLRISWQTTQKKISNLADQKELEHQKKIFVQEIIDHQTLLQKSLELKEKILIAKEACSSLAATVKETITTATNTQKLHVQKLIFDRSATELKIKELTNQSNLALTEYNGLKTESLALHKKLLEHSAEQIASETLEKHYERRKDYYQRFIAQGTWVKQELDSLEQKNRLVHTDYNPSCPLCEQNLSATRKRFLKKRFETDEQFLVHRMARLKKVATALKALLLEQHATLACLKKRADESKTLTLTIDEYAKQMAKLEQTIKQCSCASEALTKELTNQNNLIAQAQKDLLNLPAKEQESLASHGEYQASLKRLIALEEESKSLIYDAQKHQQTVSSLRLIEQRLTDYASIVQEASLQEQRFSKVRDLCSQLKKIKQAKQKLTQALAAYATLVEREQDIARQESGLQEKNSELRKRMELLLQEKGSLESQLNKLIALEKEYKQQQTLVHSLDATIDDYQTIATATGKDGIQALLIEEAIPEIEQEANQLLAKLTNNQAQIFIESLRDLKNGGTKETLDIKISDTVGIRPYEMFSGGEAFRIDFALRIAISKLLARRAGTSLQTLIIDEGFGSQDEDGLSTIMDALYKIQEDFSKVIIVSHLPAMKDQFPVHFLVEKGPNGSNVRVMEQG